MWQWQLAAFALGSPWVSYTGAAAYPSQLNFMQNFVDIGTTVFGASPALFNHLLSCKKTASVIKDSEIRLMLSTGSVLAKNIAFEMKDKFKEVVNLSGGTEIGGALLAGYYDDPPKLGWLGNELLGVKVNVGSPDDKGVGELLLESSLPALPLGIVNVQDDRSIETSYFQKTLISGSMVI